MDLIKIGRLLCSLRKEKGFTQQQIAQRLNISAKTVSKWECGYGFPDVSCLKELSDILGVSSEKILSGELEENMEEKGNMKNVKFYVCPECKGFITGSANAELSCCGRKLTSLEAKESDENHNINIENVENDFYITFNHEMTKEHYISFVAYVRFDRIVFVKLYPEQNAEVRIPQMRGGRLYFFCSKHGLFEWIN